MVVGGSPRQAGVDKSAEPVFFVSYSHQDAHYVARLAEHLRSFGLPLWFDDDLTWGSRFARRIQERISEALGVIVLMSPAAEQSEWVEREILEGQRRDRLFLPILLSGERLFLLASSDYFDARSGSLPGEREIRELQRIRDASSTEAAHRPVALSSRSGKSEKRAEHRPTNTSLAKLPAFLEDGQFEHADIVTTSLILDSVHRLDNGWMRRTDGKGLSAGLLREIDDCWSHFSGGKYGFRAQVSLHAGPPSGAQGGRQRDFSELASALGWKKFQNDIMLRYGKFVARPEYPPGFFPTLRNPQLEGSHSWHDHWMETVMAVQLQIRATGV